MLLSGKGDERGGKGEGERRGSLVKRGHKVTAPSNYPSEQQVTAPGVGAS